MLYILDFYPKVRKYGKKKKLMYIFKKKKKDWILKKKNIMHYRNRNTSAACKYKTRILGRAQRIVRTTL